MKIENTIAIVTGAKRGVGQVYVAELLRRGAAKVYAGARNTYSLGQTVALDPARVMPLKLDVTNADDIATAARDASDVKLLDTNPVALSFGGALDVGQDAIDRDMDAPPGTPQSKPYQWRRLHDAYESSGVRRRMGLDRPRQPFVNADPTSLTAEFQDPAEAELR